MAHLLTQEATQKPAAKLEAKGKPVDFNSALSSGPDGSLRKLDRAGVVTREDDDDQARRARPANAK